jgi:hypothetical protein
MKIKITKLRVRATRETVKRVFICFLFSNHFLSLYNKLLTLQGMRDETILALNALHICLWQHLAVGYGATHDVIANGN